jgi:hypothetical protein
MKMGRVSRSNILQAAKILWTWPSVGPDVLERIGKVMEGEKKDEQLDKFLSDVRDSLETTSGHFLRYTTLIVTSIVTYHLVVYGGVKVVAFGGVQLTDTSLFRRIFLIVPSALLAAMAGVGYLRRFQREVYDYLSVSRYRILGETGLHELRIPGDYTLGLFVLSIEGGWTGRIVSYVVISLVATAFTIGPTIYVIQEACTNIWLFGVKDDVCTTASTISVILCLCSFIVVTLSTRIRSGNLPVGRQP